MTPNNPLTHPTNPQQLEWDLHDLFRYKLTVLTSNCDIFDIPVSDLITLPAGESKKWIKSQQPIILHSQWEAIKMSVSDVCLLPTYFALLPPQNPAIYCPHTTHIQRTPSRIPATMMQLLTEHFSCLLSTQAKHTRPIANNYKFDPCLYEQQPLQFGDSPP